MDTETFTSVEKSFCCEIGRRCPVNIPYLTVANFPKLGLLTALRFIEWVAENPEGVISLPTGKTPEYFISWTKHILENWDTAEGKKLRQKNGLILDKKPDISKLHFVQIDEFYPISSNQHNSFYHYVNKYYLRDFGLDESRALLINCDEIRLAEGRHFSEVFPDGLVDLGLRYREPKTNMEKLQQESIFLLDDWCTEYERKIRQLGGIGFFLGGIGPDGHIAFNTRGSDHYSTTRLTNTNFETQAVAAGDLGGIEISRNRLVITIGLETITFNPSAVAIVFAAGEAKAPMVADALEKPPSNLFPASVLTRLKNARFYLTTGAASMLKDYIYHYYTSTPWNQEKTDRAVIDLCRKIDKYGDRLLTDDLKNDEYCRLIPDLDQNTVQSVLDSIRKKIEIGTSPLSKQIFYHTGPHHDDIMLGLLPHIHRLSRNETNRAHFAVLTSGFTAVTNKFLMDALEDTLYFLDRGLIQMVEYPDFFASGYKFKWDKDVYHYLIKVASGQPDERRRGFSHRIVRCMVDIWKVKNIQQLRNKISDVLSITRNSYDGEMMPPNIQTLKGMIREFEEELVWAYFGTTTKEVHHLRLGFYTGSIFTERPKRQRDVEPILQQLRQIKPTVISLAFDPEGSGPDTHYKVLQAIAEAVREWGKETDLAHLRIWGYRNVWYQFHPADATHIVPVSLNAMGVMDKSFTNSYLSQVDASFPSYRHDGKFSDLSKQIWVEQLKAIQLLLGKPFFYQNESPRLRTTHGLLFFREMNVEEFLASARELEKSTEG
jgi:glucosamine-6-phosphate deaminase